MNIVSTNFDIWLIFGKKVRLICGFLCNWLCILTLLIYSSLGSLLGRKEHEEISVDQSNITLDRVRMHGFGDWVTCSWEHKENAELWRTSIREKDSGKSLTSVAIRLFVCLSFSLSLFLSVSLSLSVFTSTPSKCVQLNTLFLLSWISKANSCLTSPKTCNDGSVW